MRVLGVDPGTRTTGYGVIDKQGSSLHMVTFGVVAPGGKPPLPERLKIIHDGLAEVIAAWHPEVLSLEEAFYGKSVQSTLRIGEARAMALLCAAEAGIPVAQYAPAMVKRAAVGHGGAHKSQVQAMVQRLLGLAALPEPEDAADALAIAICHCHRSNLRALG